MVKTIWVKYHGTCSECRRTIKPGETAYYDKSRKYLVHLGCRPLDVEAESIKAYIDAQERAAVERIDLNMNPHA